MNLRVDVPIAVIFLYDPKGKVMPLKVRWEGKEYLITKLGLHHQYRIGRTLHHIFSVVSNGTFFKLNLNTENLSWRLEEVSDGLPG